MPNLIIIKYAVIAIVASSAIGWGIAAWRSSINSAYERGVLAAEANQAAVMRAKNEEVDGLNARLREANERVQNAKPEIVENVVKTVEFVQVAGQCPPTTSLPRATLSAIDKAGSGMK